MSSASREPGPARPLAVELLATLAAVLVLAALALSLLGEVFALRRVAERELARSASVVDGLALRIGPGLDPASGRVDHAAVDAELRLALASATDLVALALYDVADLARIPVVEVGLAPSTPPPRATAAAIDRTTLARTGLTVVDAPIPGAAAGRFVLRAWVRPPALWSAFSWTTAVALSLGVAAVGVAFGALALHRSVVEPIARLGAAARAVASGALDVRAAPTGPAELRELAERFNQMTASLQAQLARLAAQQAELRRAEQLATLGQLTAGIAHEVGNPLAAMLGYVEFLLDPRSEPTPAQRETLERLRDQLERIERLVGDLLALGRPDRARPPARVEPAALLEGLAALLGADRRAQGATIRVVCARDWSVATDPDTVEQIVLNLGKNALLAVAEAPGPRVVELRAGADGHGWWIEVHDTGPGVDPAIRPNLFSPFVTTRKGGEGSGLGLAVAQAGAGRLGGQVRCLSPGERAPLADGAPPGACFRLELPA